MRAFVRAQAGGVLPEDWFVDRLSKPLAELVAHLHDNDVVHGVRGTLVDVGWPHLGEHGMGGEG